MRGRVLLELAPLPGPQWPPPVVRLRRALKALGRGYGLKVTLVSPLPPERPALDFSDQEQE